MLLLSGFAWNDFKISEEQKISADKDYAVIMN